MPTSTAAVNKRNKLWSLVVNVLLCPEDATDHTREIAEGINASNSSAKKMAWLSKQIPVRQRRLIYGYTRGDGTHQPGLLAKIDEVDEQDRQDFQNRRDLGREWGRELGERQQLGDNSGVQNFENYSETR